MQKQFIESVPRNSLPIHIQNKFTNTEYIRVIYEPDEEANMPPEEDFSNKFVKAVKESEESYKRGDFVRCNTREDRLKLFKSWRNKAE